MKDFFVLLFLSLAGSTIIVWTALFVVAPAGISPTEQAPAPPPSSPYQYGFRSAKMGLPANANPYIGRNVSAAEGFLDGYLQALKEEKESE